MNAINYDRRQFRTVNIFNYRRNIRVSLMNEYTYG